MDDKKEIDLCPNGYVLRITVLTLGYPIQGTKLK